MAELPERRLSLRATPLPAPAPGGPIDPLVRVQRELRAAEHGLARARGRALQAEEEVERLRDELTAARAELQAAREEPRRLQREAEASALARLRAEQVAYAERSRRLELEDTLGRARVGEARESRAREAVEEDARQRIEELREDVRRAGRARDEAERLLRVALAEPPRGAALAQPPRGAAQKRSAGPRARAGGQTEVLRRERELAERRASPGRHGLGSPAGPGALGAPVGALEGERRLAALRNPLPRTAGGQEPAPPRPAVPAPLPAAVPKPPPLPSGHAPRAPIEPERLMAALDRLRQAAPSGPEAADEPPSRPSPPATPPPASGPRPAPAGWLLRALTRLVDESPALGGEVIVGLLPAQHLHTPGPLAYDLLLGADGLIRVSVLSGRTQVERFPAAPLAGSEEALPRHPSEVNFQVLGDLSGLARLLMGGGGHRRLGRGVARIRGDRASFELLQDLLARPAPLPEMIRAGACPGALPSLALAGALLAPTQTAGHLLTLAHLRPGALTARAFLHINSRQAPRVSTTPAARPVDIAVVCPDERLLGALTGPEAADVQGDRELLEQLRGWIREAQRV